MANTEVQNNEPDGLIVFDPLYQAETLTSAGADTWVEGTLLGRITASAKLTIYTSGAGDGSEVPIAILRNEEVFAGAGDRAGRVLISGRVRRSHLVADGVGAITDAESDALRNFTMIAQDTNNLAEFDNQ